MKIFRDTINVLFFSLRQYGHAHCVKSDNKYSQRQANGFNNQAVTTIRWAAPINRRRLHRCVRRCLLSPPVRQSSVIHRRHDRQQYRRRHATQFNNNHRQMAPLCDRQAVLHRFHHRQHHNNSNRVVWTRRCVRILCIGNRHLRFVYCIENDHLFRDHFVD